MHLTICLHNLYIYIYTRGKATQHMLVSATEHPVTTHVFKRASGQTHFHYRIASLVDNIEMSLRLCKSIIDFIKKLE